MHVVVNMNSPLLVKLCVERSNNRNDEENYYIIEAAGYISIAYIPSLTRQLSLTYSNKIL